MEDNKENNYKNIFSKAIDIDTINLTKPLSDNTKWLHIYRNYKSSDHCCHFKWTKKEIFHWLEHPEKHEKELRNVSRHLYDTSPQYWRLINYFANMCPFQYVIYPFKFDKEKYISDKGYHCCHNGIRQLGGYMVYMIALGACGRHDGSIGNRRAVVTAYSTSHTC